tara:strand:+ start:2752 stop:5205 length:2454 start_codon:yes stop_codon:yes gene_type:complete
MKARIQGNLRKTIAEVFMSDLDAGKNSYYLMLSHPTPWVNDAIPPSPRDTTQNKTDVWKNALALKKIEQEDVRLVIPRIDWKINKKYEQYEDNVGIDDNPQSATGIIENYVLTSKDRVYKCLQAGFTAAGDWASTVEPSHTYPELPTANPEDGYVWQFMYSLSEDDQDFITDDWIPIKRISNAPKVGSVDYLQSEVQNRAQDGALTRVDLFSSGTFFQNALIYRPAEGIPISQFNIANVENGTTGAFVRLVFNQELVSTNNFYNDYNFYISSGAAQGTMRKIVGFTAGTNTLTVKPAFDSGAVPVADNSKYSIVPRVEIHGDTYENAKVLPIFDSYSGVSADTKYITRFEILERGRDYHTATAVITPTQTGAGVSAGVVLSPPGGHGFNAPSEFNAKNILIRIKTDGRENVGGTSDIFNSMNEFRSFSLVKNPLLSGHTGGITSGTQAGLARATSSKLTIKNPNNYNSINFHSETFAQHGIDKFSVGDLVCQGEFSNNQPRGVVTAWSSGVGAGSGLLTVKMTNGKFLANDSTISGISASGVTAGRIMKGFTTGTFYLGGSGDSDVGNAKTWYGFIDDVTATGNYYSQSFNVNDVIIGQDSKSTAVVEKATTDAFGEEAYLTIKDEKGKFIAPSILGKTGETVYGIRRFESGGAISTSSSNVGEILSYEEPAFTRRDVHKQTRLLQVHFPIENGFFEIPGGVLGAQLDRPGSSQLEGYLDATITGLSSGASGTVVSLYYDGATGPSGATASINITNTNLNFDVGEGVTGIGGVTGEIISEVIPELIPYSGEVLYIENIKPILRNPESSEEFKIVLGF